ncbi:MAG: hypothetical protein WC648_02885 [Candidatus Paceibacterota bacterium]|jgi:hypothetical protein
MKNQVETAVSSDTQNTSIIHTHMTREIRPICDWSEWIELWQRAKRFEEMLGLLHVGLDVPINGYYPDGRSYNGVDRVIFYLKIADGWRNSWLLRLADENQENYVLGQDEFGNKIRKTPSEMRQLLARKAFDILCLNFFKPELYDKKMGDHNQTLNYVITEEPLFPAIRNFFRTEKATLSEGMDVRNLPIGDKISHNEERVIKFLLALADFIFDWKKEDYLETYCTAEAQEKAIERNEKKKTAIDTAKPWMIEILSQLDHLEILEKRLLHLDQPSIAELREIALRSRFNDCVDPVNKDRCARTIDEACYLRSPAAWLLTKRDLILREHRRLTNIKDAEDKQKKAQEKLRQLTSK